MTSRFVTSAQQPPLNHSGGACCNLFDLNVRLRLFAAYGAGKNQLVGPTTSWGTPLAATPLNRRKEPV